MILTIALGVFFGGAALFIAACILDLMFGIDL